MALRAGGRLVDIELTFGGRFNVLLKKFDFPSYNLAVAMTSVAKFAISLRTIAQRTALVLDTTSAILVPTAPTSSV
jgi:hypothetical protein